MSERNLKCEGSGRDTEMLSANGSGNVKGWDLALRSVRSARDEEVLSDLHETAEFLLRERAREDRIARINRKRRIVKAIIVILQIALLAYCIVQAALAFTDAPMQVLMAKIIIAGLVALGLTYIEGRLDL